MQLSISNIAGMLGSMAAAAQSACTQLLDLSIGSPLRELLYGSANQWSWQQSNVYNVLQASRLSTSTGSDVDTFVGDFGLVREPATYATGQVTYSRTVATASATILVGNTVRSGDYSQTYNITADSTNTYWSASVGTVGGYVLPAGVSSITVPIIAQVAGTAANAIATAISAFGDQIGNVSSVSNAIAISNGENAETDAALKIRFIGYIASLNRATVAACLNAVATIQVGLSASLAENVNEVGSVDPGHFVITVDDGSGHPPAALLSSIYTAVDLVRPVGSSFSVQPPTVAVLGVQLTIGVVSGNKALLFAAVQSAVSGYINGLAVGAPLSVYALLRTVGNVDASINNVSNVSISGTIAGSSFAGVGTDIAAPATTALKSGVVTIS